MKPVLGVLSLATLLASAGAYAQDEAVPAAEPAPVAETAPADAASDSPATENAAEAGYRLPGGFLTRDYLGILGTYNFPDSGRDVTPADVKRATGFDFIYGHQLDKPHWGYEVHGFTETFETGTALRTDFYRYGLGGDVTYAFGDGSRSAFTPFLLGGGGLSYNDIYPNTTQDDGFNWFLNVGAGFVTKPLTSIGFLRFRGEARYVYDNFADAYGDIKVGLGVEIPLLRASTLEPAAEPATKVVEVEKIVEVPTGVLDSDGDGVVDDKDKCPGTPAGTRVNGEGCPLEKIIALDGVTFEFNKARLRPDAQTILDDASETLKKYPDMKVEVAGHTDNIGDDAYNQRLSQERAAAVRDYFVEKQIPTDQMTVKGYGKADPVADNATEEGRERNRRVELRILN